MADVSIDVDQLLRNLNRPGGLGEEILQARADRVAARARILAPGTMANMITTEVAPGAQNLAVDVVSNHPASTYVINGTRPHEIRPRNPNGFLRFEIDGRIVYTKLVHHPGSRAFDFLGIALRDAI